MAVKSCMLSRINSIPYSFSYFNDVSVVQLVYHFIACGLVANQVKCNFLGQVLFEKEQSQTGSSLGLCK